METIKERMERGKKNAKVEISIFEKRQLSRAKCKTQPMRDISDRMRYEFAKIKLEVIESADEDKYQRLFYSRNSRNPFEDLPKIRMLSACEASGGRTLKVRELTEDELIKAREIMNKKVDEWLSKLKKEAAV